MQQKCIIEGCLGLGTLRKGKRVYFKGYCLRHYDHIRRGVLNIATQRDKRPAIIEGAIAKLPLGINAQDGYAIVDKEFAYLDNYRWYKHVKGYAKTTNSLSLHHIILGKPPKGLVTDHINRDKLDNRRCNLRHCTQTVNMSNKGIYKSNTSGVTGLTFDGFGNKRLAHFQINGERIVKRFRTKEEAILYRKKLENTLSKI